MALFTLPIKSVDPNVQSTPVSYFLSGLLFGMVPLSVSFRKKTVEFAGILTLDTSVGSEHDVFSEVKTLSNSERARNDPCCWCWKFQRRCLPLYLSSIFHFPILVYSKRRSTMVPLASFTVTCPVAAMRVSCRPSGYIVFVSPFASVRRLKLRVYSSTMPDGNSIFLSPRALMLCRVPSVNSLIS